MHALLRATLGALFVAVVVACSSQPSGAFVASPARYIATQLRGRHHGD